MRRISTGLESYGDGTPYEQATSYYLDHLVDDCAERARAASTDLPPRVDLLFSLTGFSPRVTVLAYKVLRPRRLVVVPSDHAVATVNTISDHVRGPGQLEAENFSVRPCDPIDPRSIYHIVKDELDVQRRRTGSVQRAYLDITGGRKVMSAAAALAAWQLDLGLCYFDGLWDVELKQAIAGSDQLLLLDNPTSLFGEQSMRAVQQSFDGGAFDAACSGYEDLAGRLARPAEARFMAALAALYRAWCDLDLDILDDTIAGVRRTLVPVRRRLPATSLAALHAQLDYLTGLSGREPDALLLSFSILDHHYRRIGRHDFAALMSYRTIERCLLGRLSERFAGFRGDAPDYGLVSEDRATLTASYRSVVDAVDGRSTQRTLPSRVGIAAAAALLHVVHDPLLADAGLDSVDGLRELKRNADARNRSVLAHGEETVSPELSRALNTQAVALLRAYWRLRNPGADLDARLADLRFVPAIGPS